MLALESNGMALQFAGSLRNDREIVDKAIQNTGWSYHFVGPKLKDDYELALNAVSNGGSIYSFLSPELKEDREVCLRAVVELPYLLRRIPERFRADSTFLVEVCSGNQLAMLHVDRDMLLCQDLIPLYASIESAIIRRLQQKYADDNEVLSTVAVT